MKRLEIKACREEDILRVHSESHLEKLKSTQFDYKDMFNPKELPDNVNTKVFSRDTYENKYTYLSALFSAGAVISACDSIMKGHIQKAFLSTRPAGHHAGISISQLIIKSRDK